MRNDLRTRLRVRFAEAVLSLHEGRRLELVEILRECGVDPRSVPRDGGLWRDGDGLHLDRYLFTDEGRIRRDDFGPMVEEFSVRPEKIPDWIPFG